LAATLLLIKSRSLLPVLQLTEEEEESIDELQNRLRRYQIYRNAAKVLSDVFGTQISYERQYVVSTVPLFLTDAYTEKSELASAIRDVIMNLPKKVEKPKVAVRKIVSLEEMIDKLRGRIEHQLSLNCRDFMGGGVERGTIIVGFLAVLEMVKQGSVMVRQANRYSDIQIERDGQKAPRYI
jgi:segregation and condensation protein A